MFRDPALIVLQLALVGVPCVILALLGHRYARAKNSNALGDLLRAVLWSLPLTWVLVAQGFGHGGFAIFFPAWFVLGSTFLTGPPRTIDYPSLWLTPALPIASFLAAALVSRWRRVREALRARR